MVSKCLECLAVDGSYSKSRIGVLVMGILSISLFIGLIVLTVQMKQINCDEEEGLPGWSKYAETQVACDLGEKNLIFGDYVKTEKDCFNNATANKEAKYVWLSKGTTTKHYCGLLRTCRVSEGRIPQVPGKTYIKNADGKFEIIGVTDNTCADTNNNTIFDKKDLFLKQCTEEAKKSKDAKYVWYAAPYNNEQKSRCTIYKECDLENGKVPSRPGKIHHKI